MEIQEFEEFLRRHGIPDSLLKDVQHFRQDYDLDVEERIPVLQFKYYGKQVWIKAITGILEGSHLLLSGPKATGKNVLCENLSFLFGRPQWNVSLNVTSDAAGLIGSDTFKNGEVTLKPGPVYEAASHGGFAVLDEINMAKNESLSVIHSALDYRRILDVPGYHLMRLHPATRFLGTMNYGYMGTRELNEALVSRFLVLDMPPVSEEDLKTILLEQSSLKEEASHIFVQLFLDLQKKSLHSEISSKPIDLRGLLYAIALMERGLPIYDALDMGIVDKCFDSYEKELVKDTIATLLPADVTHKELFGD